MAEYTFASLHFKRSESEERIIAESHLLDYCIGVKSRLSDCDMLKWQYIKQRIVIILWKSHLLFSVIIEVSRDYNINK